LGASRPSGIISGVNLNGTSRGKPDALRALLEIRMLH
jgi:hypothetical protein